MKGWFIYLVLIFILVSIALVYISNPDEFSFLKPDSGKFSLSLDDFPYFFIFLGGIFFFIAFFLLVNDLRKKSY